MSHTSIPFSVMPVLVHASDDKLTNKMLIKIMMNDVLLAFSLLNFETYTCTNIVMLAKCLLQKQEIHDLKILRKLDLNGTLNIS